MRFVAFDVETPSLYNDRICAFGLAVYDDQDLIFQKHYLVNPECGFSSESISIHGILPQDVYNAPTFPMVWDELLSYLNAGTLVIHNAPFDLTVLGKVLAYYGIPAPVVNYIDTLRISRDYLPNLMNHRLDTLCDHYHIPLQHHDPCSDSIACGYLAAMWYKQYKQKTMSKYISSFDLGELSTYQRSSDDQKKRDSLNPTSKALLSLNKLLRTIAEDNEISNSELTRLRSWIAKHTDLSGEYPYDEIASALNRLCPSGSHDDEHRSCLLSFLRSVTDPVLYRSCDQLPGSFLGESVCLTGDFAYGDRECVSIYLSKLGCSIQDRITHSTSYLIVGKYGSPRWSNYEYGNKIKAAIQNQSKGFPIQIIREADIMPAPVISYTPSIASLPESSSSASGFASKLKNLFSRK